MPTPFPGMDPYWERPWLWKQVHMDLVVDIQRFLAPRVRPHYLVAIEQRNFLTLSPYAPRASELDGFGLTPAEHNAPSAITGSYPVILPEPTQVVERYIDLLRSGRPMQMTGNFPQTQYRILVSRTLQRPYGEVFPCSLRQAIPDIPIPLRPGEDEPCLQLNQILHTLYDSAGYDLFIDYGRPPVPPLGEEDAVWAQQLCVVVAQ